MTLSALRPFTAAAQAVPAASDRAPTGVDSLVAIALRVSPVVKGAAARVDAARHRIAPSSVWPDPMIMAGVQNFPVTEPGFGDFMTMKMIGVGQTIPYPGKLSLARKALERELEAERFRLDDARLDVARQVRDGYFELVYLDRALDVVGRSQQLLAELVKATEARYSVGRGTQAEVLKARVEATRLSDDGTALAELRRATLARINAVLGRPSESPIDGVAMPPHLVRAAAGDSTNRARFTSSALGARLTRSPLPPLATLEEIALAESPALRAQMAMIEAETARAELAGRASLPDAEVSLQYGQRDRLPDMITATVSVPLPLHRRRKQSAAAAGARATVASLVADREAAASAMRAEIARLYAEIERDRSQLALYAGAIIPQGRAALESARAGFQVGRVEFLSLLDSQNTLFAYETAYARTLSDFARRVAELERIVGKEVVR